MLKIFIVADDPLARAGLSSLLAHASTCEVVAQTSSSQLVDEFADFPLPDAVVWDLGWELADDLKGLANVPVPVVVLLADEADALRVWEAGVRAILLRDVDGEQLATAVQTAVYGLVALDPDIADLLLAAPDETLLHDATAVEPLTPRENEVLHLVAEGFTNKAIGQQLAISDHTVKFHINAIMSKLAVQSRTEAVVRATRLGWLRL